MARMESLPFARGETYYNGGTINASDPLGLGGINLEGKEYLAEVNSPDDAVGSDPSGRYITLKVVRNRSTIPLKPGRIARMAVGSAQGGYPICTGTDGYTAVEGDPVLGIVDEFLPAAGVPVNDLFYVVIDGPTKVTTPHTGSFSFTPGILFLVGAGTSNVTDDAGRVTPIGSSPTVLDHIAVVGRADLTANVASVDTLIPAVVRRLGR